MTRSTQRLSTHHTALETIRIDALDGIVGGKKPNGTFSHTNYSTHYEVAKGDNLSTIAKAAGTTVPELVRLNPQYANYAKNPNLIHPGDKITTAARTQ